MPRPPYDPELAGVLELLTAAAPPLVLRPESIAELRAFNETYVLDPAAYPATSFTEAVVEAAGGAAIRLLVMRPLGPAADGSLMPGLLYLHGGGMVAGHHRVALDEPLGWVEAVPMVAVSVDYRLAPEHRHPVPVEDCYAALRWLVENAEELGVDRARIVVAGGSAGGGLAAAVALMARDLGGPALAGQLLISPMLDDKTTMGHSEHEPDDGPWNLVSNTTAWQALLGDTVGSAEVSPYAAPARATDHSSLPPAFLDVGSADLFRDETVAYASALWAAGGRAELHVWAGGYHGFDLIAPHARLSLEARRARVQWLRRTVGLVGGPFGEEQGIE